MSIRTLLPLPAAQRIYAVKITPSRAPSMILYDFSEMVDNVASAASAKPSESLVLKAAPRLPEGVTTNHPDKTLVAIGDPEQVLFFHLFFI